MRGVDRLWGGQECRKEALAMAAYLDWAACSMRRTNLDLFLTRGGRPFFGLGGIFGVCFLTLPAFVIEPWVGILPAPED